MAAAAIDVSFVAKHLNLPEPTINSVATEPTVDLVKIVLDAIAAKALEFDTLAQQKSDLEIELEGAVRGSEARCEQFKATANKALKDVEEIRQKLQTEGTRVSLPRRPLIQTIVDVGVLWTPRLTWRIRKLTAILGK